MNLNPLGHNPRGQEAVDVPGRRNDGGRPARQGGPDNGDVAIAPPRRPAANPPAAQNVAGQARRGNLTGQLHATGAAPSPHAEAAERIRMPARFQGNVQPQAALRLGNPALVSVQDGKIGSFYVDGSRVRTAHREGPGIVNEPPASRTLRFELDKTRLVEAFRQDKPDLVASIQAKADEEVRTWGLSDIDRQDMVDTKLQSKIKKWAAKLLYHADFFRKPMPDWATPEPGLAELPQMDDQERTNPDRVMFEVSDGLRDGELALGNHMSRGVLRQMPMTDRDILAVQTASAQINPDMPPAEANQRFYDTVSTISPGLAELLRKPEEV